MTNDDALFGYRQQVFAHAARTTVAEACRTFGIHRSTYYRWKRQVERHGLEMLRPRERRRPQMPNALPKMVEERIVSFAIAHPGLGPQRVASELARPKWGGIWVSKNGVWRTLRRHGLSTRRRRLALVAGYAAPTSRLESPQSATCRPIAPASSSAWTAFSSGACGDQASGLAAHRDRRPFLLRVGRARDLSHRPPYGRPGLKARPACRRGPAGGRLCLERVLCDNGGEFRSRVFCEQLERLGARRTHIHAGRPQTNGNVESLHKTILDECWRPAFARYLYVRLTGLRRELATFLDFYNHDRVHHGRLTAGQIPADVLYGARKMEAR